MKKKNLFGWFAMAAMLVGTGCSTDEVVNNYSPENAIQFGTYVGRNAVSRATVIDKNALGAQGFGVFAYYTGQTAWTGYETKTAPNFMNNQWVYDLNRQPSTTEEESGSTETTTSTAYNWTYSPVKYWPNNVDDKVSFFAYAPYTEIGTTALETNITAFNHELTAATAEGDGATVTTNLAGPYVKFVMDDDVKDQIDLLWAAPSIDNVKNATENNVTTAGSGVKVDDKVTFNFKHALAKIGFKVQAMVDKVNEDDDDATTGNNIEEDDANDESEDIADETTIVVNSVTLKAPFYKEGVLNLNPTISTGTDGTETVEGLWSNQVAYTTSGDNAWTGYVLSTTTEAAEGTTEVTNFKRSEETVDGATVTVNHEVVTTDEKDLNAEDSYIMIIPKDFPTSGEEYVEITVVYTVTTVDENLDDGKSKIENTVTSKFKGINFEAGKAYTFCLHLGMTSVKLEADITDWATATEYAVNVPLNTTSTTTGGTTQP